MELSLLFKGIIIGFSIAAPVVPRMTIIANFSKDFSATMKFILSTIFFYFRVVFGYCYIFIKKGDYNQEMTFSAELIKSTKSK